MYNGNFKKKATGIFALLMAFGMASAAAPSIMPDMSVMAIHAEATDYTYSTAPEWTWSDDFSAATATFIADEDASVTEIVDAVITSEVTKEATETEPGEKTYTAKVTFRDQEYTDTKTEAITAAETPETEYTYSTAPVWTWADDFSTATAVFTADEDESVTESVDAKVIAEVTKEATKTEPGEKTYTAMVTFHDKIYSDIKTKSIPATSITIAPKPSTIITSDSGNNSSGTTTTDTVNKKVSGNTVYNHNNDRIIISSNIPTYVADRIYNGSVQYADTSAIDTNKMLLSGTLSAVNPGTYTYTVTPINGYAWADGTTASKTVTWRIVNNTAYYNPYAYGPYSYNPYGYNSYGYNAYTANRNNVVFGSRDMMAAGVQISNFAAYVGEPVYVSNAGKYVAVVYNSITGYPIAVVPPCTNGYFIMPDANVIVKLVDDVKSATSTATTAAKSDIYIYDANMKLYKTASTTKDYVTIKFGKDNANKTVKLYSGKNKSGKLLFETKTDSDGTLSFNINHGKEYSVVIG